MNEGFPATPAERAAARSLMLGVGADLAIAASYGIAIEQPLVASVAAVTAALGDEPRPWHGAATGGLRCSWGCAAARRGVVAARSAVNALPCQPRSAEF